MNKKNIIILVIAVVVVVGLSVFFISNMPKTITPGQETSGNTTNEASEKGTDKPNLPPGHVDVSGIVAGELAPDFMLKNIAGEEKKLSDYRGKLVYLNFWATWCVYCDEEMPDLQALSEENEDLVVLAVNVREDKDLVESYLEEGGYTFPVLLDETGDISAKYLVSGMPTTYFINTKGILLDRIPGMMEKDQMEEILGKMRELEN